MANRKKPGDLAAAVGMKRSPDVAGVAALRDSVRATAEPATVTCDARPTDLRTPFQQEIESCGDWYRRLAKTRPELMDLVACMIAFRRCHAVAYREMYELFDRVQAETGETLPAVFGDFVTQLFLDRAAQPFNTSDLMRGMVDVVAGWMASTLDRHVAADAGDAAADDQKAAEARVNSVVPVGVRHSPTEPGEALYRTQSLVFVGWRNAVLWLLERACTAAAKTGTVVQLLTRAPQRGEAHSRLIRVAPAAWHGCANSARTLGEMITKVVAPAAGAPVDLVACGDLAAAFTAGLVGRPPAALAGDAHRRLRKWCDGLGAACVAAIPTGGHETPDTTGPEFYQLNTYAIVRPVTVRDAGDFYHVVVGAEVSILEVLKAELDAFGSLLVSPDTAINH